MQVSIFVNFKTEIPSMNDKLLLYMLKNMTILYFQILKKEHEIRSIAIRKFANIMKYLLIFKMLDLDYFTVQTHASGQSAYNLVK